MDERSDHRQQSRKLLTHQEYLNLTSVNGHSPTNGDRNKSHDQKLHAAVASLPPRRLTSFEQLRTSSDDCQEPAQLGAVSGAAEDLSSPSVQMEIVRMRDELKQFHDLKLHHKHLEARLTARIREDGGEAVTEVHY